MVEEKQVPVVEIGYSWVVFYSFCIFKLRVDNSSQVSNFRSHSSLVLEHAIVEIIIDQSLEH